MEEPQPHGLVPRARRVLVLLLEVDDPTDGIGVPLAPLQQREVLEIPDLQNLVRSGQQQQVVDGVHVHAGQQAPPGVPEGLDELPVGVPEAHSLVDCRCNPAA